MGSEVIVALLGPMAGGIMSMVLFLNRRNSERIDRGFSTLNNNVNCIERKIDDIRVDVAKNYVTNDDLTSHIQAEETWHEEMNSQMREVRVELRDIRNSFDRMTIENRDKHC